MGGQIAPLSLTRPYAAVLFDMDGTLVDSRQAMERIWRRWAAKHGLDAERLLAVAQGRRSIDTVRDFATEGMDLAAEAAAIDAAEVADTDGVVAIAGASALLAQLPRERWAVVTSAGPALAQSRLGAAGLPMPPLLITSLDVAHGKPDPQGYRLAAERLGTTADQCLVFEDAPAGIAAGQRAGADVVAITAARHRPFDPACPAVADFTEVAFSLAG
jgi:sugar-phosphatase